jgi:hypothetical protein
MANHAVQDFCIHRAKGCLTEVEPKGITARNRETIVFPFEGQAKRAKEFQLKPLV